MDIKSLDGTILFSSPAKTMAEALIHAMNTKPDRKHALHPIIRGEVYKRDLTLADLTHHSLPFDLLQRAYREHGYAVPIMNFAQAVQHV